VIPVAILAIFAGGDNDNDVINIADLSSSVSITVKKFLAKGNDNVIAAANAIPLAQ